MINTPWIDPRSIDYTDGLNPLANPGYLPNNNPYAYASLQEPIMLGLRNGIGIEPRILVCPDPLDQLIQPGATYDFSVPVEPNTWLYGLNVSSQQAAGFYLQITDSGTGATVFSQPVFSKNVQGTKSKGHIVLISAPRLFVPPAYPVIRIVNNSASANLCTVNLFCAVEMDLIP
jgi:hypothetical protein